jgi:hypothetical protein
MECFDCNHAVAEEQIAAAWVKAKGIAFEEALRRVREAVSR